MAEYHMSKDEVESSIKTGEWLGQDVLEQIASS
jgi:hypothetical protein